MDKTANRNALAWLGIGCSILAVILLVCPLFTMFGAVLGFIKEPELWDVQDTAGSIMCTSVICIGLLFTIIAGGFSIYYLITSKDK